MLSYKITKESEDIFMKEFFKDWKVHALCLGMVLVAEFIGIRKFALGPLSFSLLPMLYALVFGMLMAIFKLSVVH